MIEIVAKLGAGHFWFLLVDPLRPLWGLWNGVFSPENKQILEIVCQFFQLVFIDLSEKNIKIQT